MKPRPILVIIGLSIVCGAIFLSSECHGETDRFADKERLTASDLYADGDTSQRIKELLGRLVRVEVVVTIERDVPLVKIIAPNGIADADRLPIQAHLVSVTTEASELKKGRRLLIEGVIVDEGYSAYMIYLHRATSVK